MIEAHPAANIYPLMTADEFEALKSDIASHGLRQEIILLDGQILDGRHREQAIWELRQLGYSVEPRYRGFEGGDPVAYVHSLNFHRRHLSVTQKACIGVEYKRIFQDEVKQGQRTDLTSANICGSDAAERESRSRAAKLVGVSHTTIGKAEKIAQEAPAVFDAMKDGGISVWQAERDLQSLADGNPPSAKLAPLLTSNSYEWYTPPDIIERACRVLGSIELDPCTTAQANETVKAQEIYTIDDDGLSKKWLGSVWLNPPYGDSIGKWTEKLQVEYERGNVTKAIALVPARTDTAWFRKLREYPRCFVYGRIQFTGPQSKGNGATFPSVAIAFGCDLAAFKEAFHDLGDTYELSR